jgi:hypothetical protein
MQIHSVGIDWPRRLFTWWHSAQPARCSCGKFSQRQLLAYNANTETSMSGLEACSGAHFSGVPYGSKATMCVRSQLSS